MKICIIAALAPNGAIGFHGRLPWNIPEDLRHFKLLTLGHTVIMGRRTFQSLPCGALPGRRNIVVSSTMASQGDVLVVPNIKGGKTRSKHENSVWSFGGEGIYHDALTQADELYLTRVESTPPQADAFFPEIDWRQWKETKTEKHNGFSFAEYVRL